MSAGTPIADSVLNDGANGLVQFATPHRCLPDGIAIGPDGNVWFTEAACSDGHDYIARISPAGETADYVIPTAGAGAAGIVAGSDGNLWFTESEANKIGRITPGGVISEFSIPASASEPRQITAGPDGNLWFTQAGGADGPGRIGRITPEGKFSEFVIPHPHASGSSPFGIAVGPDGNLWFTDNGQRLVGRITTRGQIRLFQILGAHSLGGITAGPDGNLWFTTDLGSIGRMTPSGAFRRFAVPTQGSEPTGIAVGPDRNLWFTDFDAHRIGRITTRGKTSEYEIPNTHGYLGGIVAAPDGYLWFTESRASMIGRAPTTLRPSAPLLTMRVPPRRLSMRVGGFLHIAYTLSRPAVVRIVVSRGSRVLATLATRVGAGPHTLTFRPTRAGHPIPPGDYTLQLRARGVDVTRTRMLTLTVRGQTSSPAAVGRNDRLELL